MQNSVEGRYSDRLRVEKKQIRKPNQDSQKAKPKPNRNAQY